eukprot:TRINITY_DN29003_c0_g2_i1.p1 TRINITY_DN29003_c0_g2~~TRINITY_DN29003_c0_g2_i1.p1  ORF type:complete len:382 (-),score=82.72 TRINITY_DN29003_c0_g2_i1:74-1219(-)
MAAAAPVPLPLPLGAHFEQLRHLLHHASSGIDSTSSPGVPSRASKLQRVRPHLARPGASDASRRCVATARRGKLAVKRDGGAFLFCGQARIQVAPVKATVRRRSQASSEAASDDAADDKAQRRAAPALLVDALRLPQPEPAHAALLIPALAAAASRAGLATGGMEVVATSCLPLIVPFSMPQLSPIAWFSNKRALAYNRCVIVSIYVQGAFAVLKFASGNVVGGFFDGCQVAMGVYSLMPDGMRLFPTYMMMSGFNGIIGLLQVLQQYNGVPLHWLPTLQVWPPLVSVVSAYFCWQFLTACRDIVADGGLMMPRERQQESCLVRAMGGDWWPAFLSASIYGESAPGARDREADAPAGVNTFGGPGPGFSVFEGSGHRLGEA